MKIISVDELTQEIVSLKGQVLELSDVCFRGNLDLVGSCFINFRFCDSTASDSTSFGNVTIHSSNVEIEGLRLNGCLYVGEGCSHVTLTDCIIIGSIRLESNCESIQMSKCVVCPERSVVGVCVSEGSSLHLDRCHIEGCVSGVAVTQHAILESVPCHGTIKWVNCNIHDCVFLKNGVDVLLDIYIHGAGPDDNSLDIPVHRLLQVEPDTGVSVDISIRGIFNKPVQFKKWPLILTDFPVNVLRRGGSQSGRYCRLHLENQNLVITQDHLDAALPTPKGRKRKQPELRTISKAESYYARLLEIEPGSTKAEVMTAYRRLALKHHPDKSDGSGDKFILIKRARDELMRIIDD